MAGRESSGNASREQAGRSEKRRPRFKKRTWGTHSTPLSDEEVEKVIRKKDEKRRRKYRAVHGKVVDWVDYWIEEGWLFVSIRFQDQTDFWLQFGAKIVAEEIALRDVRSGKLRLVRQYLRRRGI